MLYLGWRFRQIEDINSLRPYSSCSSASARWSIHTSSEIVLTDNSSRYDSDRNERTMRKTQYWFLRRLNFMSEIHDLLAEWFIWVEFHSRMIRRVDTWTFLCCAAQRISKKNISLYTSCAPSVVQRDMWYGLWALGITMEFLSG